MADSNFRPFAKSSYGNAGGGQYKALHRIEEARYEKFDFNGKAATPAVVLHVQLQPVDESGDNAGEATDRRYILGQDYEVKNNGHAVISTGQYDRPWSKAEFSVFMDSLMASGFDVESLADTDDIGALDGCTFEFGLEPSRKEPKAGQKPQLILVPRKFVGKATASKTATKKAAPAAKAAAASTGTATATATAKAAPSLDAEETLQRYLAEKVLIGKYENDKGIDKLQARMGLAKFVKQECNGNEDDVKAVSAAFNDTDGLKAILDAAGWQMVGSTIKIK